jgi:hypothetical protein
MISSPDHRRVGALARLPGMAATGFHTADELNALLPGTLPGLLGLTITAH